MSRRLQRPRPTGPFLCVAPWRWVPIASTIALRRIFNPYPLPLNSVAAEMAPVRTLSTDNVEQIPDWLISTSKYIQEIAFHSNLIDIWLLIKRRSLDTCVPDSILIDLHFIFEVYERFEWLGSSWSTVITDGWYESNKRPNLWAKVAVTICTGRIQIRKAVGTRTGWLEHRPGSGDDLFLIYSLLFFCVHKWMQPTGINPPLIWSRYRIDRHHQ